MIHKFCLECSNLKIWKGSHFYILSLRFALQQTMNVWDQKNLKIQKLFNNLSYFNNLQSRRLQSCHDRSLLGLWRAFRDPPCRTAQPPPGPSSSRPAHLTAWPAPGECRGSRGLKKQKTLKFLMQCHCYLSTCMPDFFYIHAAKQFQCKKYS